MPAVSVVIPVYKVEKYVQKCAVSVFGQTLQDLEIIFVDDASPDNSMSIIKQVLEEYPNRKNQVKFLKHEVNQGLAKTRTDGFKAATGDYILACDSDDYMDVSQCEKMYNQAINDNADLVWCDYYLFGEDFVFEIVSKHTETETSKALQNIIDGSRQHHIWGYMVSNELVNNKNILWPKFSYGEDLTLTFQFSLYSKRSTYLNEILYHYRFDTPGSYTNPDTLLKFERNISQELDVILELNDIIKADNNLKKVSAEIFTRFYLIKNQILKIYKSAYKAQRVWSSVHPEVGLNTLLKSSLNWKQKLIISTFYFRLFPIVNKLIPSKIPYMPNDLLKVMD